MLLKNQIFYIILIYNMKIFLEANVQEKFLNMNSIINNMSNNMNNQMNNSIFINTNNISLNMKKI